MDGDPTKAARDLLAFYVEAGVDVCLDDEPAAHAGGERAADVLEQPEPAPLAAPAVPPRPPPSTTLPLAPDTAVMAARQAAKNAASLGELRRILEGFEGCVLKQTSKK